MRFAQFDDESRLQAMTELWAFDKYPGENINELLVRFQVVRDRAAREGNFQMTSGGSALQIIKAAGISSTQLIALAQPFGGRLPTNEQELDAMCSRMRRTYHSIEGHPGNIATWSPEASVSRSIHGRLH